MEVTDTTRPMRVPYACTVHGEEEIAAVVNVLRTSTQMGHSVRALERAISALFDKNFGVMVNSGSSANYLAVEILNLPPGSEVITPILTFSTTVAPLVKHQLLPVFIDVEADTFNIDIQQIEAMITPNTRAMMIPNLLGNLPHWPALRELATRYQLILIEDSADTLGSRIDGAMVGQFSDLSTTSFYGSHIINCAGNGGMLCVNDAALAEKALLLRSWGRSSSRFIDSESIENRFNQTVDNIPYDAKFVFETIGYNLEPSEMGAAFGLVQLNKLPQNIQRRAYLFQQHLAFFKAYEEFFILPKQLPNSQTAWLAFPLILQTGVPFTRNQLQIFLEKALIQTRTIFTGNILKQPGFKHIQRKETPTGYPQANRVMKDGLLIGCHHGMTTDMMDYVHDQFALFLKTYGHRSPC